MRRALTGVASFLSLWLASNIYTDLRGVNTNLIVFGSDLIPFDFSTLDDLISDNHFVLYNLPDGLWMFSFCLLLFTIWGFKKMTALQFWLIGALIMGFLFEILQLYTILPGSFDLLDMLTMGLGFIGSIFTARIIYSI